MPSSATLITRLKVQLKLCIARLRFVQSRDEALSKQQRRAMAQLLEVGKVDSAKIRVENIIRSDITVELYEILELYCELLLARAGLLEAPVCDPGLEEAAKSIIYAAPKTEIKELQQVRILLGEKFGKEFVLSAMENSDGKVSGKVLKKLSVTPPKEELVVAYLEEIARAYGVEWPRRPSRDLGDPPGYADQDQGEDDRSSGGGQGQEKGATSATSESSKAVQEREDLGKATPPRSLGQESPLHINPPSPSTENIRPKVTLNSTELKPDKKRADAGLSKNKDDRKGGASNSIPDVDELASRFAALKR